MELGKRVLNNDAVYVALPSYNGWYSGGTQAACDRATRRYSLKKEQYNSSLLTKCFNVLWVRAVMSGCRYWAMIHADVNPPPGWLDTMIGDMDRLKATMMSACISLKNEERQISCAMCRPDTCEPHHILTLDDLEKLPPIFTGWNVNKTLGVDGDLLVNTGLWVADLSAEWVYRVWFEFKSSISWTNYKLAHISQASEDWLFSQKLHEHGVTVYATQKMRVGHLGQKEWVCGGKTEE